MLKVIQNILSWPIFRILSREEELPKEEEEEYIKVPEHVSHDFTGEERESCPWLDLGDRAAAFFGSPALKVYLELQQFHSYLTGSLEHDLANIIQAEYVDKSVEVMRSACGDFGVMPPLPPEMPPLPPIPTGTITAPGTTAYWISEDRRTRIEYTFVSGHPELTTVNGKWIREAPLLLLPAPWIRVSVTDEDRRFVIKLRKDAEARKAFQPLIP